MTLEELLEIEAIKVVKYRYQRAVDTRDWELMATLLTEDATCAYSSGRFSYEGRDAIIGFLRASMPQDKLSTHLVHQPEIELTGPDTAKACWAIEDVVIIESERIIVRGAAYYRDRLRKVDGEWRIAHTGYRRLYETREEAHGVSVTKRWWTEPEPPLGAGG